MKTCGYQKKAWENLFYLLTFQDIEDNFDKKNNGYILITKTQSLNSVPNVSNISALPENRVIKNPLFNENPLFNADGNSADLTSSDIYPKTFSYLKRASEPLSKFIQASIKYGYLC